MSKTKIKIKLKKNQLDEEKYINNYLKIILS